MKVKLQLLKEVLALAKPFAQSNPVIPILDSISISKDGYVFATDTTAGIMFQSSLKFDSDMIFPPAAVTVLQSLDCEFVDISYGRDALKIVSDSGKYTLPCGQPGDFIECPKVLGRELDLPMPTIPAIQAAAGFVSDDDMTNFSPVWLVLSHGEATVFASDQKIFFVGDSARIDGDLDEKIAFEARGFKCFTPSSNKIVIGDRLIFVIDGGIVRYFLDTHKRCPEFQFVAFAMMSGEMFASASLPKQTKDRLKMMQSIVKDGKFKAVKVSITDGAISFETADDFGSELNETISDITTFGQGAMEVSIARLIQMLSASKLPITAIRFLNPKLPNRNLGCVTETEHGKIILVSSAP